MTAMRKYFVHNIYEDYHSAKKTEKMLTQVAEREFKYCLIPENRLETVVERLCEIQDKYLKANPRVKAVAITVGKIYSANDCYRTIHIGGSSIQMIAVKAEIE